MITLQRNAYWVPNHWFLRIIYQFLSLTCRKKRDDLFSFWPRQDSRCLFPPVVREIWSQPRTLCVTSTLHWWLPCITKINICFLLKCFRSSFCQSAALCYESSTCRIHPPKTHKQRRTQDDKKIRFCWSITFWNFAFLWHTGAPPLCYLRVFVVPVRSSCAGQVPLAHFPWHAEHISFFDYLTTEEFSSSGLLSSKSVVFFFSGKDFALSTWKRRKSNNWMLHLVGAKGHYTCIVKRW